MKNWNFKQVTLSVLCLIALLLAIDARRASTAKAQSEGEQTPVTTSVALGMGPLYIVRGNKIYVYGNTWQPIGPGDRKSDGSALENFADAFSRPPKKPGDKETILKLTLLQTLEVGK